MRACLAALVLTASAAGTTAAAQTPGIASRLGPIPPVPALPPPPAVIPPIDLAPPHPTAPPPLPIIDRRAPGTADPTPTGLRVLFGATDSDLNPAMARAVRALAATGRADPAIVYQITAYAPGSPEDESSPRRLSLARGLALRSLLVNAGIPSTRVYVHALGARGLSAALPANRADIVLDHMQTEPAPSTGPRAAP
jgi:outer membrane protein OmpA-like peptidoglycan-associated protein